jgi:hypothetical protein
MTINIWIRREEIDELSYFLSDDVISSGNIKIEYWYFNPSKLRSNDFISVFLNYREFKKLEDL